MPPPPWPPTLFPVLPGRSHPPSCLQEILNTVGMAYVNDTIRNALRLSNADRARQLALRREQVCAWGGGGEGVVIISPN